ncbi:hypothetical protein [Streptomyces sindenensis]|uniref:hypothetical protein n=1 Tax=Streptomyces sindenensis TaxID=67363 RepID=UPI00167ACA7A|nr:hypothetical protein [Streptomyces sindenensis]GGP75547.1 hypothetical protein GCM10010231_53020 [Streptomyces sindenensis]
MHRSVPLRRTLAALLLSCNRLGAAAENAKGDPLLSKAVAPLTAGAGRHPPDIEMITPGSAG